MVLSRVVLVLCVGVFLTSCATKLETLRNTRPMGTAYQVSLAQDYLAFAESEADQYDWFDSRYFAKKGLLAAWGNDVSIENPDNWSIPAIERTVLEQARGYLMQVLTAKNKADYPAKTAKAHFLYDCWLEQLEENWQFDHIAACREEFYAALDELFELSMQHMPLPHKAAIMAPEDAKQMVPEPRDYVIYFGLNKTGLDAKAEMLVQKVVDAIGDYPNYDISLNGYTDASGKVEYNMNLSKKRASAVKEALVNAGLDAEKITIFAFGESDLKVETADGIKNTNNRRVEVEVAFFE